MHVHSFMREREREKDTKLMHENALCQSSAAASQFFPFQNARRNNWTFLPIFSQQQQKKLCQKLGFAISFFLFSISHSREPSETDREASFHNHISIEAFQRAPISARGLENELQCASTNQNRVRLFLDQSESGNGCVSASLCSQIHVDSSIACELVPARTAAQQLILGEIGVCMQKREQSLSPSSSLRVFCRLPQCSTPCFFC